MTSYKIHILRLKYLYTEVRGEIYQFSIQLIHYFSFSELTGQTK